MPTAHERASLVEDEQAIANEETSGTTDRINGRYRDGRLLAGVAMCGIRRDVSARCGDGRRGGSGEVFGQ
jgi:hypothetical protein